MRPHADGSTRQLKRPGFTPGLRLGAFIEAVVHQRHRGGLEGRRAGAENPFTQSLGVVPRFAWRASARS